MEKIGVKGLSFTDEKGRSRVFNGYNIVYKGCAPDPDGVVRYPDVPNDEMLVKLAENGVNILRLGMTWAGVEPEPEAYNETYLEGVKAVIRRCEKYGVYVFVDFHQDLFSAYCYSGDGAPRWACKQPADGRKTRVIWAEGYFFSRSVQRSFDAFWRNEPVLGKGLRDRFCEMLRYTVRYLNDCPNVIGYDVFNEPFPGSAGVGVGLRLLRDSFFTLTLSRNVDRGRLLRALRRGDVMEALSAVDDPVVHRSMIMGAAPQIARFDRECYTPFLCAAAAAIRAESPNAILFMENSYFSNLGIPCETPRVTYPDGSEEKNLAFAPHGYDITVDTPPTNEASPHRVDFIFNEHRKKQPQMNVPVLVGEWGGMVPGGERYPALEHLIDRFDANGWSQTYWHYSPEIAEGRIGEILRRPYPMAVAGEIVKYGYDRKNDVFDLSYTGDGAVKAPTLIYLPKPPARVYSTKQYRLLEKDGSFLLLVNAGKGACAVKVEF